MADLINPALFSGGGMAGLLGLLFWMLATGRLVTRREADTYIKRAETAEESNATLVRQLGEMTEMAQLGQHVFTALKAGAE